MNFVMRTNGFRKWFWTAIAFQLITGLIHSISLFVSTEPSNETERQMEMLISTYRIDAGAGFHPTFSNLFTALSSCFSFLCIFAALVNGYLLWKRVDDQVLKGILAINAVIFAGCFTVMSFLTFLPPIICTGLIVIASLISYFLVPKVASNEV